MKVLVIDFYQGTNNVGGLRWQRFCKYLPGEDIQPVILTSGEPDLDDDNVFHVRYPFEFKAKNGNTYSNGIWGRVKGFIRGNFFIPDPRRWWFATCKAVQLVNQYKIPVVITTGPPHSVHLIGLKLKRKLGVKWIADFRDPWHSYWYKDFHMTDMAKNLSFKWYTRVVEEADKIIAVEPGICAADEIVSNGFDPDDFKGEQPSITGEFVYVGSLTDRKLLPPIEFKHVQGVSHEQAIKEMRQAGYLLVAYPDDVIPSKIYEYMASGRPILSFGIRGKGAELIERCGAGKHYPIFTEYGHVIFADGSKLRLMINYCPTINRNEGEVQKYNIKNITKQLAGIICNVNAV